MSFFWLVRLNENERILLCATPTISFDFIYWHKHTHMRACTDMGTHVCTKRRTKTTRNKWNKRDTMLPCTFIFFFSQMLPWVHHHMSLNLLTLFVSVWVSIRHCLSHYLSVFRWLSVCLPHIPFYECGLRCFFFFFFDAFLILLELSM